MHCVLPCSSLLNSSDYIYFYILFRARGLTLETFPPPKKIYPASYGLVTSYQQCAASVRVSVCIGLSVHMSVQKLKICCSEIDVHWHRNSVKSDI